MPRTRFTPFHRGGSGEPLLLLHGFTDTWRSWEAVLPALEQHHDVLAPTLVGHAGGPDATELDPDTVFVEHLERVMDDAGFDSAHVVGNSLGGHIALHLAARGRTRSVTALAPAGGWPVDGVEFGYTRTLFEGMQQQLPVAARIARLIASTRAGRRYATRHIVCDPQHISRNLLVHQIHGAHACQVARPLLDRAAAGEAEWDLDFDDITCPVRIAWGTADKMLRWPVAATQYREAWLPDAEWIELEGVGHCPQLDAPELIARLILEHTGALQPA